MAGLGSDPNIKSAQLKAANLLHWSGPRKPWMAAGYYQGKWAQYYLHWTPPRRASGGSMHPGDGSTGPASAPPSGGSWLEALLGWLGWGPRASRGPSEADMTEE